MGFALLFAAIGGLYSYEAVAGLLRRSGGSSWASDALYAVLSFTLSLFTGLTVA